MSARVSNVAGLATIRTVGGVLPADVLAKVVNPKSDLPGLSADAYLTGPLSPREAANRAWAVLVPAWRAFRTSVDALPPSQAATGLTRDRWLAILFRELHFGLRLRATPAGGLTVDDRAFAISHNYDVGSGLDVPMHLLGWNVELDRRTPGVPGAAERAPHALVQEYLNRADTALWAFLSNGRTLRMLRDASTLIGQSYVEFDLATMFDGEIFSDFVVLFLTCHESRFALAPKDTSTKRKGKAKAKASPKPADGELVRPEDEEVTERETLSDCWLERWRIHATENGTRALAASQALGCPLFPQATAVRRFRFVLPARHSASCCRNSSWPRVFRL